MSCAVVPGLYEDTPAPLTPLDFVMSPTGRGCCNEHPLHPRVPGGLRHPWTPNVSRTAFFAGQLPFGASASGDLPGGMRMCARLPMTWRSSDAFTHALVATHVPPPSPGVTRFYARHFSFGPSPTIKTSHIHDGGSHNFSGCAAEAVQAFAFPPSLTPYPRTSLAREATATMAEATCMRRYASAAGDRRRRLCDGGSSGVADARRRARGAGAPMWGAMET